eukprot:scaffold169859_cov33-Tisochrysis_lutea.AAC.7
MHRRASQATEGKARILHEGLTYGTSHNKPLKRGARTDRTLAEHGARNARSKRPLEREIRVGGRGRLLGSHIGRGAINHCAEYLHRG